MEVQAVAKYVKVQPRKVRIVARQVKGQAAVLSSEKLKFHPSKGAHTLRKVLESAMANAEENMGVNRNALRIKSIAVDEGPTQKRITQKAQGRGARINKKTSHITVIVEDYEPQGAIKPHGSKAKPRPKFEVPKKAKAAKAAPAAATAEEAPAEEATTEETAAPVEDTPAAEATAEETAPEATATEDSGDQPAEEEKND